MAPSPTDLPPPSITPSPPGVAVGSPRQATLRDFLDELLWPTLLRAGAMSLRPERIAIAYVTLLLISLAMHLARLAPGAPELLAGAGSLLADHTQRAKDAVLHLAPAELASAFTSYAAALASLIRQSPWAALACALPWLLIAPVGAAAICRLTAIETAHRVMAAWPVGVGFSLRAAKAAILAVLAPLILVALGVLALAVAGAAIFSVGPVGVVGAIFYVLALAAAAGLVLLAAGWLLGLPLLVPSVACEGPDPIDAVQRVLAYLVGRPLRLAAYSLVLIAELVILAAVVNAIVHATLDLAAWSLSRFAGPEAAAALAGGQDDLAGAWKSAARIIRFWREAFLGLVPAVVFSFVCAGWTIAYLLVRQLHDGQDRAEIWMPGMIPGTLARTSAADDDDDE
ncbi:MAG: hypothetical protein JNL50_11165 [Phycisphaerae bacterium]|nr:hypothetical protein [Phycisphaerae bacterium]